MTSTILSYKIKIHVAAALVLAALPAAGALAQTPDVRSTMVDILFDDADGSGDATCGDEINYVINVDDGDNSFTNPTDVVWRMDVPANAEVVPGSVVAGNPFEPAVVVSGNAPGDRVVLVDFGEICGDPQTCGPTGASMNLRLRIVSPNSQTELSVQGEVTGSNFPTTLTDDLSTAAPNDPTVTPYEACPVVGEAAVTALQTDSLASDGDGDTLADGGDVLVYRVTVRSTGTTTAQGLLFQVSPGPDTRLVAGTVITNRGLVVRGNGPGQTLVSVELEDLAPSQSATILYQAEILEPVALGVTEVLSQGVVTGTNVATVLTDDPDLPGAADPTVTPLDFDPDLAVAKSTATPTASPGDVVVFEVTGTNLGRSVSGAAELREAVPDHSIFNPQSSSPGWICPTGMGAGSTCTLSLGALGSGESASVDFAVEVLSPLPVGVDRLVNTVAITDDGSQGPDLDPTNNQATASVGLVAFPDLAVTKSDHGASVEPGQTVLYTITAQDLGQRGATGVVLEDTVPEHTRFETQGSDPGWVCTGSAGAGDLCTLELGSLSGGGGSALAVFTATVDPTLPAGVTEIENIVTVRDDGTNGPDTDPGNNTATELTPLTGAMPDLGVEKTLDSASDPRPGGLLVWEVAVSNTGNQAASGLALREQVPAHTTFAPASSDPGWSCEAPTAGSACTLDVGTLAAGSTFAATFAVVIDRTLPPGVDSIENCAAVGEMTEGCDLVTVSAAPDLEVTKDDGGAMVSPGGEVSYEVTFSNVGSQGATGVVLEDELPAATELVAENSDPRWSCQSQSPAAALCRLDVGVLGAGDSGAATLTVRVDRQLPETVTLLTNRVVITDDGANGDDPTPGNNEATETTPVEHGGEEEGALLEVTLTDILAFDADGSSGASTGDTLGYVVRVTNVGGEQARDVVFTVAPDPNTELLDGSALTSQGSILTGNASGDSEVAVDLGALAPGAGADVSFEVRIAEGLGSEVQEIVVQGLATAANAPEEPSDDPETPEDDDPTRTPLARTLDPHEIPTASEAGLALLALLLSAGGVVLVRRRGLGPDGGVG
jgi:uncharacterized repeat protein (TIGR01451 family)